MGTAIMTAESEPPRIEFPCDYVIRVIGNAAEDFREFVIEVMERHAQVVDPHTVSVRESSNGRYLSVTITIVATGEQQLRALDAELKASGRVHMVL